MDRKYSQDVTPPQEHRRDTERERALQHMRRILGSQRDQRAVIAGLAAGCLGLRERELRTLTVPQLYEQAERSGSHALRTRFESLLGGRREGLVLQRRKTYRERGTEAPLNRMTLWRILKSISGEVGRVMLFFRRVYQSIKRPGTAPPVRALPVSPEASRPAASGSHKPRELVLVPYMRMMRKYWKDPDTGKLYDRPTGPR